MELNTVKIRNALRDHGQGTGFLLTTAFALALSLHAIFASPYPFCDGQGYAARGFALYG